MNEQILWVGTRVIIKHRSQFDFTYKLDLIIVTGQVRLEPGEHTYIFQCLLPPNLPTSLETEYGYIRYTARVVLDNPQCPDKSFAVPFTVIKAVDLNNIPELRVIYQFIFIKTMILEYSKRIFQIIFLK